jgi:hypothetical protein
MVDQVTNAAKSAAFVQSKVETKHLFSGMCEPCLPFQAFPLRVVHQRSNAYQYRHLISTIHSLHSRSVPESIDVAKHGSEVKVL